MEVIYLLIPVSLLLIGLIVWLFVWAIQSGQFDDMEGPAHRILMDDDDIVTPPEEKTGETDSAQRPQSSDR